MIFIFSNNFRYPSVLEARAVETPGTVNDALLPLRHEMEGWAAANCRIAKAKSPGQFKNIILKCITTLDQQFMYYLFPRASFFR